MFIRILQQLFNDIPLDEVSKFFFHHHILFGEVPKIY